MKKLIGGMVGIGEVTPAGPVPERMAMDRMTVRSYDTEGRMHVEVTNISKANVCGYYGREIPDAERLGLDMNRLYMLYRDPVELLKAAPTFNNLPLLSEHTYHGAHEPKKEFTIGTTGSDSAFNPPYLQNSLAVWDADAIKAIETGEQKELSSSYRYEADMTPGVADGEAYDGRMVNIIGNHVALVTAGRAGADVVVGDSKPSELLPMKKVSMKAVALRAALGAYLRPALANDAQPIPLSDLIKDGSPSAIAAATRKHYAGTLDVDATKLTGILSMAADEAEKDEKDMKADDEKDEEEKEGKKGAEDEEAEAEAKKKADDEEAAKSGNPKAGPNGANDAALVKRAEDNAFARFKAIRQAENDVRPIVGELVAMDSAEAVYRAALDHLGVDHKGVHHTALATLVKMAKDSKDNETTRAPRIASDAAAVADVHARFNLKPLKVM